MASSSQHTTIVKPRSVFSDSSSFSLPTAYYEQTTPYQPNLAANELDENENFDENPESYNFNPVDDNYDLSNFVEAYNPNVQVNKILFLLCFHFIIMKFL